MNVRKPKAGFSALWCLLALLCYQPLCPSAPQDDSSATNDDTTALIGRLGAPTFSQRKAARDALAKLLAIKDPAVLSICVSTYLKTDDPEVRSQLRDLLMGVFEEQIRELGRGFLGIRLEPVQYAGEKGRISVGIRIVGFLPDSAAAKAGLHEGDIITAVDDIDLSEKQDAAEFTSYIQSKAPGSSVTLHVMRGEGSDRIKVALGAIPEELQNSMALTENEKKKLFYFWLKAQSTDESNSVNSVPGKK